MIKYPLKMYCKECNEEMQLQGEVIDDKEFYGCPKCQSTVYIILGTLKIYHVKNGEEMQLQDVENIESAETKETYVCLVCNYAIYIVMSIYGDYFEE